MSGAYVFQSEKEENWAELAGLLSSQMSLGQEKINHYGVFGSTLLGVVSPDPFKQGVMPRYVKRAGLWGLLLGRLYDCSLLGRWRQQHKEATMDLEVLATMWRSGDLIESLPNLNGAFFVVLWDPERRTLVAANDRFGLFPMYWSQQGARFCLASRALCSVVSGVVEGEWNRAGVAQMLAMEECLDDTTLVNGVSTYPQATVLTKQDGALSWERFWRYEHTPRPEVGLHKHADNIGECLIAAVRRRCTGDQKTGITLSGGLDSRCIAAAASKAGLPLRGITWASPGSYDRRFAKRVAAICGVEHQDIDYDFRALADRWEGAVRVTEGLCSIFDCHMFAHLDLMDIGVDVFLDGYGGGILTNASSLRTSYTRSRSNETLAEKVFAHQNVCLPEGRLSEAMPDAPASVQRRPSETVQTLLRTDKQLSALEKADVYFLENRMRRSHMVGLVQIRSAFGVAPCYLDYDYIDALFSVPVALRRENRLRRVAMRATFPEVMGVPWQRTLLPPGAPGWLSVGSKAFIKGCRILESRIGWPTLASRQATFDFAPCLRGPLRAWMGGICSEAYPLAEQVLRPDFCTRAWNEHLAGKDRTGVLGVIAALRGFSVVLQHARAHKPALATAPTDVAALSEEPGRPGPG